MLLLVLLLRLVLLIRVLCYIDACVDGVHVFYPARGRPFHFSFLISSTPVGSIVLAGFLLHRCFVLTGVHVFLSFTWAPFAFVAILVLYCFWVCCRRRSRVPILHVDALLLLELLLVLLTRVLCYIEGERSRAPRPCVTWARSCLPYPFQTRKSRATGRCAQ